MSFKYCPNCSSEKIAFDGTKLIKCPECGFEFYHNTASAVAGILVYNGDVLFTVRNQEPQRGSLDLPGGFTDPGESAEDALKREVFEELGLKIEGLSYLGTFPNEYPFKDILYTTCDVVFVAEISELPKHIEKEEISAVSLIAPQDVVLDEIPFNSIRSAVAKYINQQH